MATHSRRRPRPSSMSKVGARVVSSSTLSSLPGQQRAWSPPMSAAFRGSASRLEAAGGVLGQSSDARALMLDTKGSRPTYLASLRDQLLAAEASVDEAVQESLARSDAEVERAQKEVDHKYGHVEVLSQIRDVSERGLRDFLTSLHQIANIRSRSKPQEEAAAEMLSDVTPGWQGEIDSLEHMLVATGYSHRTRWRTNCKRTLAGLLKTFRGRFADVSTKTLFRAVEVAMENVNVYTYREMLVAVAGIAEKARVAECLDNVSYRACYGALNQQHAKMEADEERAVRRMREHVAKTNVEKQRLLAELARLEAGREAATGMSFPEHGWWTVKPHRNLLATDLEELSRTSAQRAGRNQVRGGYLRLLADCCKLGAWRETLLIYEDFVMRDLGLDAGVFHLLITACKNAIPSEDAKCVAILEEMQQMGVMPGVDVFNCVMDATGKARHWRRCFKVFEAMQRAGVKANTASYNVVADVCATAALEDAPAVYEAMRAAGIPEYVCYSSALAVANADKKGPVELRHNRHDKKTVRHLPSRYHM